MGCCNKLSLAPLSLSQTFTRPAVAVTARETWDSTTEPEAQFFCSICARLLPNSLQAPKTNIEMPFAGSFPLPPAAASHLPLATCRLSASREGKCWARHSTGGQQQQQHQLLARLAPFSISSQGWARDKPNGIVCHEKSLKRTELKAQIVGQQLWKYFKLKVKSSRIH